MTFKKFYLDIGKRPAGMTLGRFGAVGNYRPGGCKWMTRAEQQAERLKKRRRNAKFQITAKLG
jgi:hypothetical protein